MPDVRFAEIDRFASADGERGIYLFRQTGTAPPKLGSGRFDTHGCDIFLGFTDGLLSQYKAAYDIARMLEQMEALPPRGNKLGGAYLLSLAARAAV